MKIFKKIIGVTLFLFFNPTFSFCQTVLISPTVEGGFETGATLAANGWAVVDGTSITWFTGTAAGSQAGTKAAFVGSDASTYIGSTASVIKHFYRDIAIPVGATQVYLNYYLKMPITDNTYDYFYVYTNTTSQTPVAGILPAGTQQFANTSTAYAGFTAMPQIDLTSLAGTTVRLVFTYKTDAAAPYANPAVDNISLVYTPSTPMTFTSCSTTQGNVASVSPGSNVQEIIGIQIVTSGSTSPLSATQFTVNANGSTNINDVNAANSAKIYYTGTSSTFATITLFGQNTPTIANFNINGTQLLSAGTNYFWLVYDIKPGATIANIVDGQCTSLNVSGARTPTVTSPAGSRPITSSCSHIARLTDTYGDGWNGGSVTINVNGVPVLTNITLAAGSGPLDFAFNASSGDVINFTQTAAGSFPSEMRVEIITGTGSSAIAPTLPVVIPGINTNGCCIAIVPGVATNPTPANGAVGISPCSLDFSWTAPANTGCNGATSYDIYFGTIAAPPFLINRTTNSYSIPNALLDNTTYYLKIVPKNGAGNAIGCPTWSFTTGATTNPYYCFYGSSTNYPAGGSNCAQLTPNIGNQNGCAWNRTQISFASAFDYSVNMYFGAAAGGADGCAFVFQNSTAGISQCGSAGGQLGAGGISNAVVIEFDTYDNDFPMHVYDMAVDHTAIEVDGDMQNGPPLCGPIQADPLDGLLADGLTHVLRITWDPLTQTMRVLVDGSTRLTCVYDFVTNVFGGNPNVYWGFTASTGALANQQFFCPVTIPLPVSLASFSVGCKEGKHQLDWYTFTETNNDYFTIERSADGINFTQITKIKGAGNSNESMHYSWSDEMEYTNTMYYRLNQTDLDGKSEVLGMQSIQCNKNQSALSIKLAFASSSKVFTEIEISDPGYYTIEVRDLTGRLITSINNFFERGSNSFDLLSPSMGSGMYLISVCNENVSAFRKFITY